MSRIRKPRSEEQKQRDKEQKYKKYHEVFKYDPVHKDRVNKATREWQLQNPEKYMWGRSRQTALAKNLDFNIEPSDINIPEMCPILNEPLVVNTRYTPSLDRIDSSKGYVKGNVWVISNKANSMKSDSTVEEMKLFAKWVRDNID